MAKKTAKRKATIEVRHVRPPTFRNVPADGVLIRSTGDVVTLTFYTDDRVVKPQKATSIGEDAYELTAIEDEPVRTHEIAIRTSVEAAVALSALIVSHLQSNNPEALKKLGFVVSPTEQEAEHGED